MNVLDRDKLLLALRGKCILENVPLAWVQDLSQEDASQVSSLCIDSFEPISIPVPQQEIRKLKPRADRVPGAKGIWSFEGDRVELKSEPPFTATQFDENLKSTLLKKAILQLGLDSDYHSVTIEPYKLLIYETGSRMDTFTHNFEQKSGAFGMLMLQIPVEGGHRGAELTVRHGLEANKLDRSRDNGHLFYLSASFIDYPHEISPINEGWSLVLSYHLVLNTETSSVTVPHGMRLPKFFSALNTVQQISSPLNSPTEDCDTEMLVIPLANDYARIPLSYENLRGPDQLMASLLQSTNFLEVRLATIANYRAGTAYDERRMIIDRAVNDDGYPDSPRQLELEPSQFNSKRRFVAEVMEEDCSINEFFLLNGQMETSENSFPIVWNRDYIFNNIESAKDLFDEVSPPDREKYDRYHTTANGLELKQWWYKPVLVAYPKDSVALKCRKHLSAVVADMKERISQRTAITETEDQQAKFWLMKIANHLNRKQPAETAEDEDFRILLEISTLLKAKEEGLLIWQHYTQFGTLDRPLSCIPALSTFIGFAGWTYCIDFFTLFDLTLWKSFMNRLIYELLKTDCALRNEAAVAVYRQLFITLFLTEEIPSREIFASRIDSMLEANGNKGTFFVNIFLLERRCLLANAEELMTLATGFIDGLLVDLQSEADIFSFVEFLSQSSLVVESTFQQMHIKLQHSLVVLCKRFLNLNRHLTTHPTFIVYWIRVFVFVGDRFLVQKLTNKLCSFPPYCVPLQMTKKGFLSVLLSEKKLSNDVKFKAVRSHLKRAYNTLLKQSLYEVRRSVTQLKIDCSRLDKPSNPVMANQDPSQFRQLRGSKLRTIVDRRLENSLDDVKLSKEEKEEEFISLCNLLNVCNTLKNKNESIRVLTFLLESKCFESQLFLRSELLSAMAAFAPHGEWKSFRKFYLSIATKLKAGDTNRWLTFQNLLTYHLLKLNDSSCNSAALSIFHGVCSKINFPASESPECLFSIEEPQRHVFMVNVLLLDLRQLLQDSAEVKTMISYVKSASTSCLSPFVRILFSKDSPLGDVTYYELNNAIRELLKEVCKRFVDNTVHSCFCKYDEVPRTEDLLNWLKLILYVRDVSNLKSLLKYISFSERLKKENAKKPATLRELLANKDFRTQPQFKAVREHPIVMEWKKRMQKQSFNKLFLRLPHQSATSSTNKRKFPEAGDLSNNGPKRVRFSSSPEDKNE